MAKTCIKEGCNNPRFGKGYCKNHQYLRTDLKEKKAPRKRIKPISESLSLKLKEYRIVRDIFMKDNPNCECCGMPSQDLHHKKGRGKNLSELKYFMSVCRKCHNYIHENPKRSRELLYLL